MSESVLVTCLVIVVAAYGVSWAASDTVPVDPTEAIQPKDGQWQVRLDSLQAALKGKASALEARIAAHKEQPALDSFARVYVARVSLIGTEGELLSELSAAVTTFGLASHQDRRRKEAYAERKSRELADLLAQLEKQRKAYQALDTRLKTGNLTAAERDEVEASKSAIKAEVAKGMLRKADLEKTLEMADAAIGKLKEKASALGLINRGLQLRLEVLQADLRSSREKVERARNLGPDPMVESYGKGLEETLKLVTVVRGIVPKSTEAPDIVAEAASDTKSDLLEAAQAFLSQTDEQGGR